jgi:hypothetical protein
MTTATWVSQPVPAMGAIKAEGIKNQLGRLDTDRLTVLVREAAQNSWDAASPERTGPVRFAIDFRDLDATNAQAWRHLLTNGAPTTERLPLRAILSQPELAVLFVSDRGATGLGGPTRADRVVPGEAHDYVSFVLNVGDSADTPFGGGTFGYGKAVFFQTSAASTILVYTRCTTEAGTVESRMVGCALGPSFAADARPFTGRHWFGVPSGDEIIDPIRGDDADAIAAELGLPPFTGAEFGTTVAVLAPKLDGRGSHDAMRLIADSILWHLWPKMLGNGHAAMDFSVSHNEQEVPITHPAEHPVLREFVSALDDIAGGDTITYGSGATPIGKIVLRTTFAPPPVLEDVAKEAGLDTGVHHCCLLRVPELVVEYRQGPPLPDERIWYVGVFKVLPEHDQTFAAAEPPTHDAWSPAELDDRERSIVRTTLRKIDEALKRHASPHTPDVPSGEADGLATISRFLGSLLAPAAGFGAGPTEGDGTGSRRSSPVRMVGSPRWDKYDDRDVLIQEFDVDARRTVTVEADASVRVWGGAGTETAAPLGAARPKLVCWRAPDGTVHARDRIAIDRGEGGRWEAIVSAPPDTAIRVRVHEAKGGATSG